MRSALVRDRLWALRRDRLRTADAVAALAGDLRTVGRDRRLPLGADRARRPSTGSRCGAATPPGSRWSCATTRSRADDLAARVGSRTDALHRSRAVRAVDGALCFVYKAAAEIGELGDNVAALRATIARDELLRAALGNDTARVLVLGHTRWASVGIISEANAHPLDQEELDRFGAVYAAAALNGDVDNYAELVGLHQLQIAPEITTDAKVIPAIMARGDRGRRRARRRVPRRGRELRGIGRDRRAHECRARPRVLRAARQRPGALRRHRRGRVRRRERAVRARRGDPHLPAARRRDAREPRQPRWQPRPARGARRDAGRHARRHHAGRVRRHRRCPVTRRRPRRRPRSPPATSTAATSRTTCSRRSPSRRTRSARRCGASSSSATARCTSRSPTARSRPTCGRGSARARSGG